MNRWNVIIQKNLKFNKSFKKIIFYYLQAFQFQFFLKYVTFHLIIRL